MRVEVRAALSAADRQTRQCVLEHLLEREELQNVECHARMEAQAPLIGTECARHLHTKSTVNLDLALIIHPRYTECDDAVRLDHRLQNLVCLVLWMLLQQRNNGGQNLGDRILEMCLIRITLCYQIENIINILFHFRHYNSSLCLPDDCSTERD